MPTTSSQPDTSPAAETPPPGGSARALDAMAVGRFIVGPGRSPPAPVVPGFDILRFIARGGSAHVWHALRTEDGAAVALKIALDTDPEVVERVMLEAETLRSLEHPNIVRMLDQSATDDGRPVLVMELVDGPNLAAKLPAGGFSFDETLRLMLPVLDAVTFAHERGIIHRDLKPSNILLTANDTPKVSDFGLARPLQDRLVAFSLTNTGAVAGTVEYLPPESYQPGYEPTAAGDIYALGILLYELLTGTPPRGAWKPLSSFRKLDVRLDELISEAIALDPSQRLKSAAVFRRRLETIRDSKPRYAGSALLTKPIRTIDAIWTVAGLYFLAAGFCSIERINNTQMPAVFDLTFNHSRLLGGFWATWVLGTGMGLLWLWQIVRLWHFRRVPFIESLPAPFGLKLEPSRSSRIFTAVTQILCGWIPVIFPILIAAQTWHWLTDDTPPSLTGLVVTPWSNVGTVSMWKWDPAAFLDGGSYWIKEVSPGHTPAGPFDVRDKQSFLIFTQPLLLALGAGAVALGVVFTLLRFAFASWPSRKILVATLMALCAASFTGIGIEARKTFAQESRHRSIRSYSTREIRQLEESVRHETAGRIAGPVVARLFDELHNTSEEAPAPLPESVQEAFAEVVEFEANRIASRSEALELLTRQKQAAVENREIINVWDHRTVARNRPYEFEHVVSYAIFAEPFAAPATGAYCDLRVRGLLPTSSTNGFISYWRTASVPLYAAEHRLLTIEEATEWVGRLFQSINTPECPGLEHFFLGRVIDARATPSNIPVLRGSNQICENFRNEHLKSIPPATLTARELPPPVRLPGARWHLIVPIHQSDSLSEAFERRPWEFEIVFRSRWQIHRIAY